MGLDIRLPIGLLFGLLGVILSAYGVVGDKAIYERSLGTNINLQWGLVMLAFGVVMGSLGYRGMKSHKRTAVEQPSEATTAEVVRGH